MTSTPVKLPTTDDVSVNAKERRVLVLMPVGIDNERCVELLQRANIEGVACAGLAELKREIDEGAGAVLLTDEIVAADEDKILERTLREQPAWSSLPVVVLAREGQAERVHYDLLGGYNGVVVIERPVRTRSLVSSLLSSLRARSNQYQVRDVHLELAGQAEQLRKADRLKNEFLATLAHELRNPLAPILTGLALLVDTDDAAQRERTTGIMQRQIRHMARLIEDLLDVSRITRGMLALQRAPIAIKDVLALAIEGSTPILERHNHTLVTELADDVGKVLIDADLTRVAQVVGNLLNNAAKYTRAGGLIRVTAERQGATHVTIAVSDNGMGIPADRLDDIFEMFHQVNPVMDRSQGGLGIGLALVRRLVELHGGSVAVKSAGTGKGSTFTVRLPLAQPADDSAGADAKLSTAPPPPAALPSPSAMRATQVLIVDDNNDAAEMLALLLQMAGYETTEVHDGPAALAAARAASEPPDVVVLDIGLPGMSGYEVARELRKDARFAQTTLIAVTGWGSPEDRKKALNAGFDLHLTKPVATEDLKAAVAKATQRRRQGQSTQPLASSS